MKKVGIVIVSHSPLVAEGTADMVRQMVGDEVPLAWCGGNPDGGLGTSVAAIMSPIRRRLSMLRRNLRAAAHPFDTWSSCIALVGSEWVPAGTASR